MEKKEPELQHTVLEMHIHIIWLNQSQTPTYLKYYGKSKAASIGGYGNLIRGLVNYSDSILLVTSESNESYKFNMHTTDLSEYYLLKKDQNIFYAEMDSIHKIIWNTVYSFNSQNESIIGWDIKTKKQFHFPIPSAKRFTLSGPGELFFSSIDDSDILSIGRYNYVNDTVETLKKFDGPLKKIKRIFHFFFDKDQNVLFFLTLNNGLFWVDLNDNSVHEIPLTNHFIYGGGSIEVGKNNELYISTDIGIFIVDKITKTVKSKITKKNGLSYPIACNVLEDDHNNLWISTFSVVDSNISICWETWHFVTIHTTRTVTFPHIRHLFG